MANQNSNSVQFARKYNELKKANPFHILEAKRQEYHDARKLYYQKSEEYTKLQNTIDADSKAYMERIDRELKPLAITIKDTFDIFSILD